MARRIELTDEQRAHLLDPNLLPHSITVNGKVYTPQEQVAAGFKGAVWRVRDEFARDRALKLCTHEDYQNRSYLEELSRASALESHREFAHFIDAGLVNDLELGTLGKQTFVCFVE